MPTDDRPATPRTAFNTPDSEARGKWILNHIIGPVVDYGKGVFDNRPDQPGQPQARKKILSAPVELVLPKFKVKSLGEMFGGGSIPVLDKSHVERGITTQNENAELDRIAAERAKAQAEAEERKRGQAPGAGPIRYPTGNTPNIPRSIVLGAASAGIRYALKSHTSDGRAVQLAALAARVFGAVQGPGDLSKAKIGHAVVSRLGLLGRRALRPPGSVVLGTGINATADTIDVSALVNVEGLDP